jgi:hypothetical protein
MNHGRNGAVMENIENQDDLELQNDDTGTENELVSDDSLGQEGDEPEQDKTSYLVRQKMRFKREAERTKAENEALKARLDALERGRGNRDAAEDGIPVNDDDVKSYMKSVFRETFQEQQFEEREHQRQARMQQDLVRFEAEREKAALKIHDYDEVTEPITHISTIMAGAQLAPQGGDKVLYYLGKKTDELERILRLPEPQQAREVISLAMKLAQAKTKSSEAPAPVNAPKKGNGTVKAAGSDGNSFLKQCKEEIRRKQGWK